MSSALPPALQAQALACVRGRRTLFEALELTVERGQLLRVDGPNGAGKTSLLRLLAGLTEPAAGQVRWQGLPIARQREAFARQLLYMGHLPGLKDELSALENLLTDTALLGLEADDGALRAALAHWGLQAQLKLPVRVLSAGQRRRVALARLSLVDAPLWILDEPFNALDSAAVAQLGLTLDRHLARGGLAVITSHQALPVPPALVRTLRLTA